MWRFFEFIQNFKEFFVYISLGVICFSLISISKQNNSGNLYSLSIGTVAVLQHLFGEIPNPAIMQKENTILTHINLRLLEQNLQLQNTIIENAQLRELHKFHKRDSIPLHIAKVVGKLGSEGNLLFILEAGEKDSILPGMPVLGPSGLLGEIIYTSHRYAVVRSLYHTQSRIAAVLKQAQKNGIVKWHPQWGLILDHISQSHHVERGDYVLTSPYSTKFPAYLPIGLVDTVISSSSSLDYIIRIAPRHSDEALSWVGIMLYQPDSELQKILHTFATEKE